MTAQAPTPLPGPDPETVALRRRHRRALVRWYLADLAIDALALAGAGAFLWGVWQVSPEACFILGGILAMATAYGLHRGRVPKAGP